MKKNLLKKHLKKAAAAALALALTVTLLPAGIGEEAYAASSSRYITSNASSLPQVTGLSTLQRDDDEVRLSWKAVDGASGYEVYRYSTTSATWILLGRTDLNTFEAEDLLSASIYSFRVRAFAQNADGKVVYGNYSKTFRTCTRPKDVDNLRASSKTASSVTLAWTSVKRADRYQVYKYNRTTGTWTRLITTAKNTYKATGLKSGTTYKFKVRSYRNALGYKYYSDFETITVTTKKAASSAGSGSNSGSSASSGLIGTAKAKSIALSNAGISASNASFTKVELDYDDGIHVYEIEFISGNYEYEYEINANTGKIVSYDREYAWD